MMATSPERMCHRCSRAGNQRLLKPNLVGTHFRTPLDHGYVGIDHALLTLTDFQTFLGLARELEEHGLSHQKLLAILRSVPSEIDSATGRPVNGSLVFTPRLQCAVERARTHDARMGLGLSEYCVLFALFDEVASLQVYSDPATARALESAIARYQ